MISLLKIVILWFSSSQSVNVYQAGTYPLGTPHPLAPRPRPLERPEKMSWPWLSQVERLRWWLWLVVVVDDLYWLLMIVISWWLLIITSIDDDDDDVVDDNHDYHVEQDYPWLSISLFEKAYSAWKLSQLAVSSIWNKPWSLQGFIFSPPPHLTLHTAFSAAATHFAKNLSLKLY